MDELEALCEAYDAMREAEDRYHERVQETFPVGAVVWVLSGRDTWWGPYRVVGPGGHCVRVENLSTGKVWAPDAYRVSTVRGRKWKTWGTD